MVKLTKRFKSWLSQKNWRLHTHQIEMLEMSQRPSQLLIAPTGAGKTLAGFLLTLSELETASGNGLHTLYISPPKALAADIKRNLMGPIEELGLQINVIMGRLGLLQQTTPLLFGVLIQSKIPSRFLRSMIWNMGLKIGCLKMHS